MPLFLMLFRIYLWHLLFQLYLRVLTLSFIRSLARKDRQDLGNRAESGKHLLERLWSQAMENQESKCLP